MTNHNFKNSFLRIFLITGLYFVTKDSLEARSVANDMWDWVQTGKDPIIDTLEEN